MNRAWHALAVCRGDLAWLGRDEVDQLADCEVCPVALQCLQQAIADRATSVTMGGVVIGKQPLTEARIVA